MENKVIEKGNKNEEGIQNTEIRAAVIANRKMIEKKLRIFSIIMVVLVVLVIIIITLASALNSIKSITNTNGMIDRAIAANNNKATIMNSLEVVNLIMDKREKRMLFHIEQTTDKFNIEMLGSNLKHFKYGATNCAKVGDFTSMNETSQENEYVTEGKGIWISIQLCGEGYTMVANSQNLDPTIALLWMPEEAMIGVTSFRDFEYAVRKYAIVYHINQERLSILLDMDVNALPPNQLLPKPPAQ